jgi:GAF domain-containing protein
LPEGMTVKSPGITWPEVVLTLLEAGRRDPESLTAEGLAAARRLSGADGAALVRWHGSRPALLAADGATVQLDERPPEGPCTLDGRPLAVVTVEDTTDLVVVGEPGTARFDLDTFDGLRALAALVARGSDQPRKAIGAVYDVATKILGSLDLDEVLLAVANAAAQLLRAEIAGMFLLDSNREALDMRCVVGHRSAETAKLRIPRGKGLAGRVLETGRVMRVDDYATDPKITKDFVKLAQLEGAQSAISAPIAVQGKSLGVLNVWRRRRSVFADDDIELLVSLAHLAAVAVENARLYEVERTSAAELRSAHLELEQRFSAMQHALDIHEQLTRIAAAGNDVATVVRTVSELTSGTVALLADDLGTFEGPAAGSDEGLLARVRAWLPGAPASDGAQVIEEDGRWAVVAPVRASGVQFGHLCLSFSKAPGQVDLAAAEQAATVCALLLAREEAALSAARRLQSEFVWDLLEGRIPDKEEALLRARHLGHGFRLPARVLLVAVQGLEQRARVEHWSAEQLERTRGAVVRALGERVQHASMTRPVLAPQADQFAVIVPTPRARRALEPRELARVVVEQPLVQPLVDGLVQVAGVSGVVDAVSGLPRALRQARFALSTTRPGEPVGVFDDLGVLQFLLSPATRDDLDGFAERVVGPLLAYDAAHRTRLVESLDTYLACDCHLQRAADRLFVHPKTMRYRLQRVQDLAGLALDTQEDRFNAQLALKILRVTASPPRS